MKTNEPVWRNLCEASDAAAMSAFAQPKRLVERASKLAGDLPGGALYRGAKGLTARLGLRSLAGLCDLRRFASGRIPESEIRGFRRTMVIRKGYYDYEYFNVCFLNNVLALCLKAVCAGYIPRVEILNSKGENIWERFFEQPFADVDTAGLPALDYDEHALEAFPAWSDIYYPRRRAEFERLYGAFARLNPRVRAYAEGEIGELLAGRRVLGVLCRGTDYTATRPKGHPIQPERADMLKKVHAVYEAGGYEYVYLATEEGEYDRLFRGEYGDRLLINRRNYYDQVFAEQKLTLIKDVHFDREDDEYLKGLEYISSLQILAHCDGLVAGNCGGTQAAVLWNGDRYGEAHVFDAGEYA